MMRHIVLFRRLPGVESQPELESVLVERMRSLTEEIDFIRAVRQPAIVPVAAASVTRDFHIPRTGARRPGSGLHLDSLHPGGRLQE